LIRGETIVPTTENGDPIGLPLMDNIVRVFRTLETKKPLLCFIFRMLLDALLPGYYPIIYRKRDESNR